jgi:hypothetical protein
LAFGAHVVLLLASGQGERVEVPPAAGTGPGAVLLRVVKETVHFLGPKGVPHAPELRAGEGNHLLGEAIPIESIRVQTTSDRRLRIDRNHGNILEAALFVKLNGKSGDHEVCRLAEPCS